MLVEEYLTENNPYKKVTIDVDLNVLKSCFDDIELDSYANCGYRYRALNRFIVGDKGLEAIAKEPLYQSSRVNTLWGNMDREFMALDFSGAALKELEKIVKPFLSFCNLDERSIEVGVHPIRTIANNKMVGHPAPEGAHSDGYIFTSIFVIRRDKGIRGANTYLYRGSEKEECIFEDRLNEGEGLLIDDKSLLHYTSPMKTEGDDNLTRDILAITISPKGCDPKKDNEFSR